jgi:hopanoid-associated phosphorylase
VNAVDHQKPVIAVTGLSFEARIAAGAGVTVVCGGDRQMLFTALNEAVMRGASGIISFGTAGGLAYDGVPGRWVVAPAVVTESARFPTSLSWSTRIRQVLSTSTPADIAGVDVPVADPQAKRLLHLRTGAAAVDMESHVAAATATARGLPFAACRVIIDPLCRALPPAALLDLRSDGTPDIGAVIKSLLRRPGQMPALMRIAMDARAARAALQRGRRLLGAGLGFPDFGEPERDMAGEYEFGRPLPAE